ncbi:MAG: polyprenyl synthetase family protein [Desulfobacteraceae bacterium]|nr:MAG: polyprenyl synthetase family protein [Desulfobacteraceae bacterium]
MDSGSEILDKYSEHITKINKELKEALTSRVTLAEDIGKHTLLGNGKRLRPLFFVLSCQICNYQGRDTYRLSTIFEYLHAASLLHDDVVDNAENRRNRPSANNVWGNHAAVLEGDFLYSNASLIAVGSSNLLFLKRLTETAKQMAEGQIMELVHTYDWETTKEEYMEIITAKTAVLMSAACACGAIITGAEKKAEQSLEEFGLNMGIAFQLMDDLLDYISTEEVFGKPVGKDLKEGKITLPLIYTLPKIELSERNRLEHLFKNHRATEEDYRKFIDLMRSKGALDKTWNDAKSYVDRAAGCLSMFPDSPAKRSLLELNQFIVERKY